MRLHRLALVIILSIVSTRSSARAQESTFAALTKDGNGIEALQKRYAIPFRGAVSEGLRTVARRAQPDISFDESLPGLTANVTLPDSSATLASLVLRLSDAAKLSARVSRNGQVVIVKRVQPGSRAPRLTGVVRDSLSGEGLSDVRVLVRGSAQISASRGDGSFSVSPADDNDQHITFSRIGYRPKSLVVTADDSR